VLSRRCKRITEVFEIFNLILILDICSDIFVVRLHFEITGNKRRVYDHMHEVTDNIAFQFTVGGSVLTHRPRILYILLIIQENLLIADSNGT
jgi:hypothetical protein